jgi:hypothetical protein
MSRCDALKQCKRAPRVAQPAEVALFPDSSIAGAAQPRPACATFSEEFDMSDCDALKQCKRAT